MDLLVSVRPKFAPSDSKTEVIITQIGSSESKVRKFFIAHDRAARDGSGGVPFRSLATFGIFNKKRKFPFYKRNFGSSCNARSKDYLKTI